MQVKKGGKNYSRRRERKDRILRTRLEGRLKNQVKKMAHKSGEEDLGY